MSFFLSLPEELFYYINSYLKLDKKKLLLSSSKDLRKRYFYKCFKLKLNCKDSIRFITDNKYRDYIFTKNGSFNNVCLNFSGLIKRIRDRREMSLFLDNLKHKDIFKLFHINTLNLRIIFEKCFSNYDLLKLFNIKTLIITCHPSFKEGLLNKIDFMHNERNIKNIIIEELQDYDDLNDLILKEILICEKNSIKQYIGKSYNNYYEKYNEYKSVKKYLSKNKVGYKELEFYYGPMDEYDNNLFEENFEDSNIDFGTLEGRRERENLCRLITQDRLIKANTRTKMKDVMVIKVY